LTTTAVAAARAKGTAVDEALSSEFLLFMAAGMRARQTNSVIQRLDGGGLFGTTLYTLAALRAARYAADQAGTDAAVVYLLARQYVDGHWPHEDASRSPIDDGDVNRTRYRSRPSRRMRPRCSRPKPTSTWDDPGGGC
jgi:hypothetical protein